MYRVYIKGWVFMEFIWVVKKVSSKLFIIAADETQFFGCEVDLYCTVISERWKKLNLDLLKQVESSFPGK
jgi:hypothetical protein